MACIRAGFAFVVCAVPAGAQPVVEVTEQPTGTSAALFAVAAVSEQVVWVTGTRGTVLRTRDGGATWEPRPVPGGDGLQFRDVHATGADTAWVLAIGAGAASRIYRTTDGGQRWHEQFRNVDSAAFFDCFTFPSARRGIVYGDAAHGRTHILATDDGGATWALLPAADVPAPLDGEGAYAASGRCVVHAGPRHVYIGTGGPGSRLLASDDGGVRWMVRETPFVRSASAGVSGLDFATPLRGIGVAGDMANLRGDTASAVVAVTDDGGHHWTVRARPPLPGALTGVTWVPAAGADVAVAVGFGGVFLTHDGGRQWAVLSDRGHAGIGAYGRTVWVGSTAGTVLRVRIAPAR